MFPLIIRHIRNLQRVAQRAPNPSDISRTISLRRLSSLPNKFAGTHQLWKSRKKQVQYMVKTLLNLKSIPKPDDAADALALAICGANHPHSFSPLSRGDEEGVGKLCQSLLY